MNPEKRAGTETEKAVGGQGTSAGREQTCKYVEYGVLRRRGMTAHARGVQKRKSTEGSRPQSKHFRPGQAKRLPDMSTYPYGIRRTPCKKPVCAHRGKSRKAEKQYSYSVKRRRKDKDMACGKGYVRPSVRQA